MIELTVLLGLVGLCAIAGVLVVRHEAGVRWHWELAAYVLRFPRGVSPDAVAAFIAAVSGIVAPKWKRPFVVRAIAMETSADETGIAHHLLLPRSWTAVVLAALRAALPGVLVRPDEDYQATRPSLAAELGLSDQRRLLNVGRAEAISSTLLANLQPLESGEQIVVQWAISPVGPVGLVPSARKRSGKPTLLEALWDGLVARDHDPEVVKAARAKQAAPLFAAAGRIGVVAGERARARGLMVRVLAAFHLANAPGVHLRRRGTSSRTVARAIAQRRMPLVALPCVLNAAELAALVGFPLGEVTLPGLRLGGTRQLAPASDIPSGGRVVAQATFPGGERPLALSVTDSLRHLHVIGPTGVGKSTLALGLITQDMAAGRGVFVIEPKGDLVADVLDRVPASRVSDVVVVDPTDEERPVGLNLLAGATESPELVVDQVVGIFHQLYRAFWGPRTDDILRAALLTLASEPGMTLTEVPLLLTDVGFRRRLVGRIDDPVALGPFWGWYEGLSDAERAAAIGPVMNKLRAFLLRRRLRNVLGQATPHFDFDRALTDRKIVLVPLAKGLLGEEAAALLGSLVFARMWQAVQRRTSLAPSERPVTFAVVDEFQDYVRLPTSMADVLAQARGLGLGLTLAHQHLAQLPPQVREAVLANARSRVIFQVASGDARVLAHELAPHLTAADLQGLGPYEIVATLSAGARVAPPVTAVTLPPPAATGQGEAARQHSRETYGVDRTSVESAIRTRHEGRRGDGAVGRREVPS